MINQMTAATRRGLLPERPADDPNVAFHERIVSSLAGGLLAAYGLSSRRRGSLLTLGLGGALLYRGMSGRCHLYRALGIDTAHPHPATVIPARHGDRVESSITILRSPQELYSFWRELENLPSVMKHLKSVEAIDRVRSHWIAEGPLGKDVEWDAEVFNDVENEMIAWRSLPGGAIDTAGSVHFTPQGDGRETRVTVNLKYDPPAGVVGAWVASILGTDPQAMIEQDLRQFKQRMETGERTAAVESRHIEF
jgi:uncharacterized membrane protein